MSTIVAAVGIWFYSQSTNRYLYLMRNDPKHPDSFGLPGGKIEPGESIMAAMVRECEEELGSMPDYVKLMPLEKFIVDHKPGCNGLGQVPESIQA